MAVLFLMPWAVIALLSFILYHGANGKYQYKLPPGPEALPILGNIKDFPPNGVPEYQHWLTHKDLYGGISSVTVLGMTLVIIHDKKVAQDLLEQAASKTSGRPTMVMANKLCGYGLTIVCQGYDRIFRRCRKYLHQELGTKVSSAQFRKVQEIEVNRQLVRALKEPEKWLEHFKTTAAATVLKMAYGYTIEPHKPDVLVELVDRMMNEFSQAAVPMAWVVDIIPALQYLPQNFPGAAFQKTAQQWRKSIQASAYIPYRFVKRQMATSNYPHSYVSKLVEKLKKEDKDGLEKRDEEAIIWTAASLYGAAADTTVITLTTFTLAMARFPDVQRKAQEEIDRVVGTDRLPNFEDREKLPYINALVKESTRWWPIAPMGFPHTTTEDIQYGGYHIPKGAYLLPAVWWFMHDPGVYACPESFEPDRFLPPRSEPDPMSDVFGYGRRICPGRFFADSSLYLNIVQSLATFKINKIVEKDASNDLGEIEAKPKPGVLTYPTEFRVQVIPRSDKHIKLIQHVEQLHPREVSSATLLESIDQFEIVS